MFISLILVLISLQMFLIPATNSYSPDLYSIPPLQYWLVFFLMVFAVLIATVSDRISPVLGVFGTFLTFSTILTLPVLLNFYQYGRGDVLIHRGWTLGIISNGYINSLDTYPAAHTLVTILELVSTFPINFLFQAIIILFYLIFVLGVFILCRTGLDTEATWVPLIALPVLGNANAFFTPFNLSIQLIPLVLICVLISARSDKYLLVLLIPAIAIYHPLTALTVSAILVGIFLYTSSFHLTSRIEFIHNRIYLLIAGVAQFLILFVWMDSRTIASKDIGKLTWRLRLAIIGIATPAGVKASPLSSITSNFNLTDLAFADLLRAVVFRIGPWFIIGFILVMSCSLIILKFGIISASSIGNQLILPLATISLILYGFGVVSFFIELSGANYQRFFQMGTILAVPVIAANLEKLSLSFRFPSIKYVIVILILSLLIISPLSVHYSSNVDLRSSHQITETQISGISWVHDHTSEGSVGAMHLTYGKFVIGIEGINQRKLEEDRTSQSLGSEYFLTSKIGGQSLAENYEEYPNYYRYTPKEYFGLSTETNKRKIYTSGPVTIYHN